MTMIKIQNPLTRRATAYNTPEMSDKRKGNTHPLRQFVSVIFAWNSLEVNRFLPLRRTPGRNNLAAVMGIVSAFPFVVHAQS